MFSYQELWSLLVIGGFLIFLEGAAYLIARLFKKDTPEGLIKFGLGLVVVMVFLIPLWIVHS